MGAGYSIVDGNVEISKERMQKINEKYRDPSSYDRWKKQLEDAAKHNELYEPKKHTK
jgi:hypothetical protein